MLVIHYVICLDYEQKEFENILKKIYKIIVKNFNEAKFTMSKDKDSSRITIFEKNKNQIITIEIYIYKLPINKFIFGFLDRSLTIKDHKELKLKAKAKGLKMSWKGIKNCDKEFNSIDEIKEFLSV